MFIRIQIPIESHLPHYEIAKLTTNSYTYMNLDLGTFSLSDHLGYYTCDFHTLKTKVGRNDNVLWYHKICK